MSATPLQLTAAHYACLRAHAHGAAEDTDNRDGWARGHTPMDRAWEWRHIHELRDAGLVETKDTWKDLLVKATAAGWEALAR